MPAVSYKVPGANRWWDQSRNFSQKKDFLVLIGPSGFGHLRKKSQEKISRKSHKNSKHTFKFRCESSFWMACWQQWTCPSSIYWVASRHQDDMKLFFRHGNPQLHRLICHWNPGCFFFVDPSHILYYVQWFQIFCLFLPRSLGKWSNLTNIFQVAWNYELDMFNIYEGLPGRIQMFGQNFSWRRWPKLTLFHVTILAWNQAPMYRAAAQNPPGVVVGGGSFGAFFSMFLGVRWGKMG